MICTQGTKLSGRNVMFFSLSNDMKSSRDRKYAPKLCQPLFYLILITEFESRETFSYSIRVYKFLISVLSLISFKKRIGIKNYSENYTSHLRILNYLSQINILDVFIAKIEIKKFSYKIALPYRPNKSLKFGKKVTYGTRMG